MYKRALDQHLENGWNKHRYGIPRGICPEGTGTLKGRWQVRGRPWKTPRPPLRLWAASVVSSRAATWSGLGSAHTYRGAPSEEIHGKWHGSTCYRWLRAKSFLIESCIKYPSPFCVSAGNDSQERKATQTSSSWLNAGSSTSKKAEPALAHPHQIQQKAMLSTF